MRKPLVRGGAIVAVVLLCGASPRAEEFVAVPGNLIVEEVPPIPRSLVREAERHADFKVATFGGWHPQTLSMLIGTRAGNTTQVHSIAAPLAVPRQLTFFDDPATSDGYDPLGGDFFLFRRDQGGSEFVQLYRQDLRDGAVALLSGGGRSQTGSVRWNHRGDRVAYTSTRRNGADRDLYVLDPRQPKTERCVAQLSGGGWSVADWSHDDASLLLEDYVSVNESHLWRLDLATGRKVTVTPMAEKNVSYGTAAFSADDRGLYLTTDLEAEFRRLAYLDLATHAVRTVGPDLAGDVEDFSLSADGSRLAFTIDDRGASRVYLLETRSGAVRLVDGFPPAVISVGEWHRDNCHVAFDVASAKTAGDVFALDAETSEVTRWTRNEPADIGGSRLPEAQLIQWTSFDGRKISGFYYPPARKFSGRHPVVLMLHGGPESEARPIFQGRYNYLLNELGVALIYPNVRGSSGFGKTFVALDNGRRREDSVKDIGALLDWIGQQPDLDASRVMVTGASYGGYLSLACAVHFNDRIRCAIDLFGISNFVTFLEGTESYRRDLRRAEYGDERDPALRRFLEDISPLTNAAKIRHPIFVIQGANDPRVPRGQSVQMVRTIRKEGGTAWYLEAQDEGHGFVKKSNRDFQFYAALLFLKTYLLGD